MVKTKVAWNFPGYLTASSFVTLTLTFKVISRSSQFFQMATPSFDTGNEKGGIFYVQVWPWLIEKFDHGRSRQGQAVTGWISWNVGIAQKNSWDKSCMIPFVWATPTFQDIQPVTAWPYLDLPWSNFSISQGHTWK